MLLDICICYFNIMMIMCVCLCVCVCVCHYLHTLLHYRWCPALYSLCSRVVVDVQ